VTGNGNGRAAVVVGAGIGGLAAAVGLLRAGWQVTVLERARAAGEIGAGLSLFSNALSALGALGAGDAIRAHGTMTDGGGLRTPQGSWLFRAPGLQPGGPPPPVSLLMVHRAVLHEQLLAALPAGVVRTGALVTRVTPGDEREQARVSYRDQGGEHEAGADVVVGADGVRSTVRGCLHAGAPAPAYAGFTAWRGVTAAAIPLPEGSQTWGRGQSVGLTRLADGRIYWFATAPVPEGTVFGDDRAEALRRFGGWHDPIAAVIAATDLPAVLRHDVYALPRPLEPFHRGRAVLLGDAAHAMTPHLGQGACLALEDAVVLATELAATPAHVPAALARYDAARRPRAQKMSRLSDQAGRPIELTSPAAVAARNLLIRAVPRRVMIASLARTAKWNPPSISA